MRPLLVSALVFLALLPAYASPGGSAIRKVLASLQGCLKSKQSACLGRYMAAGGVSIGADGPRLSRRDLAQRLSSDKALRCTFWGEDCRKPSSAYCSLRVLTEHDRIVFGTPTHWGQASRVQVTLLGDECLSEFPLVFQLQNGQWRIAAMPF